MRSSYLCSSVSDFFVQEIQCRKSKSPTLIPQPSCHRLASFSTFLRPRAVSLEIPVFVFIIVFVICIDVVIVIMLLSCTVHRAELFCV